MILAGSLVLLAWHGDAAGVPRTSSMSVPVRRLADVGAAHPKTADTDGDKKLEVLGHPKHVDIDGDGKMETVPTAAVPHTHAADIDGDGKLEAVHHTHDGDKAQHTHDHQHDH